MAEAAVLDQETEAQQPSQTPEAKRKAGRQPGYKPFANESTPEEFMARVADISDADWPKSLVYVWRRDPFTDSTNGGREPKYIDVRNSAFTIDGLKEEHGSGSYKLILNSNEKYVTHAILTIDDPKFPPHVPPGDWQNHPRNKKWQSWKPLIDKWWSDRVKSLAGTPESNGALSPADVMKLLASQRTDGNGQKEQLMSAVIGILPQLLQQQNSASDPSKYIDAIKGIKDMFPTPAAPDTMSQLLPLLLKMMEPKQDPMIPVLIEQLKGLQQQNTALLTKMLETKTSSEKQPGPLEQMKQMSEIMSTVAGFVTPAEPKAPWQSIVEEGLPGLLDMGKAYFMSKSMFDNARARPPQPQVVQHPQPVAQPTPQPSPAPQPAPAQVVNSTVENPQVVEIDPMAASNLVMIAQYMRKGLELNQNGFQFQDSVFSNKFGVYTGEQIYEHFTSTFPKEHVLDMLRAIPQAWQEIAQWEAILPKFIEDFYTAPVEDDEPEPPPTESKSTKKKGGKK
jgi:hypothetical protein